MSIVTASDFNSLGTRYNNVKKSISFPDTTELYLDSIATVTKGQKIQKVSIVELRRAINAMETKYSNNCNCPTNPNCCQTCQTSTCQTETCQTLSCQTTTCQAETCQSQSQCSCQRCYTCKSVQSCGNSH